MAMIIVSWLLLFLHYLVLTSTLGKEGDPVVTQARVSTLTEERASTLKAEGTSTLSKEGTLEGVQGYNREVPLG